MIHIYISPTHTNIYCFPFQVSKVALYLQRQQHQNHSEWSPACTWQLPELAHLQPLQAIYSGAQLSLLLEIYSSV